MALLIGGLGIGAVYALVAIGVVLTFRATSVVNFAQGEIMMVSAYAYVLVSQLTASPIAQLAAVVVVSAFTGTLCFMITHFLLRRSSQIQLVIGTLALLIFLQSTARLLFTDIPLPADGWIFGDQNVVILGAITPVNSLVIIAVALIVTGVLFYWEGSTLFGRSVLAVAEDKWRAALTGIHVHSTLLASWVIGGVLAGIAGMLLAPITGVFPTMGMDVLIPAFIAAILGGFTSIVGALIGGLLIGMLQTYTVAYLGGSYKEAAMLGTLLVVLLWRPTGLFRSVKLRNF